MADALLDSLMEQLAVNNSNLVDRSASMQEIYRQQEELAKNVIVQQKIAGENAAIVQDAKLIAEQKAERDALAAATKLGTNPDDAAEVMSGLSKEWKDATEHSQKAFTELQKAAEVKFLDDPVGFVTAQFKMEYLAKDADVAKARQEQIQNTIRFANEATQQAVVTANALKQTKSEAVLQASSMEATAKLAANLDVQRIQNSGINLAGMEALGKMDMAQINNLSTAFSVRNQAEQLAMSRQQLAMSRENMQLAIEERKERMAQKAETKEEMDGLANIVRVGAAAMGFENVAAFPSSKIIQLLNLKDPKINDFLSAGMQTQVAGVPIVSDNAGTAARSIMQHSAPLRPEQATLKTFFADVWAKASSPEGGIAGKYDNTKLDQVTRGAQTYAVIAARDQQADIKTGDNTNIYSPPPLTTILSVPAIANSKYYKQVFAQHMQAGGLNEFNPEQVTAMTVKAIKSGAITYNEGAVGLQALFGTARAVNNVTRNYSGFGLPPQMGYRTKLPNGLGFPRAYDLTTEQDVNQLLGSRLSEHNVISKRVLDARPFGIN